MACLSLACTHFHIGGPSQHVRRSSLSSSPLTSDFHSNLLHFRALIPILVSIFFNMLELPWFPTIQRGPKYCCTIVLLPFLGFLSRSLFQTFSTLNCQQVILSEGKGKERLSLIIYWDSPPSVESNISAPVPTSSQTSEETVPLLLYNDVSSAPPPRAPPQHPAVRQQLRSYPSPRLWLQLAFSSLDASTFINMLTTSSSFCNTFLKALFWTLLPF